MTVLYHICTDRLPFYFRSLLGGPTAGVLLLRMDGSYTGMIAFSGTTIIIGSVLIFFAKLQVDPRICARV